ncbi:MAG: penicillin binding protein PBP4B [Erysipelothrix sp.]
MKELLKKVITGLAVFSMLFLSFPTHIFAETQTYQIDKTIEDTHEIISFKAYKNGAKVEINGDDLSNTTLILNGQQLDIDNRNSIDISGFVNNGNNKLEVTSVAPVTIKIPFPIVTQAIDTNNNWFKLLDAMIEAETLYGLSAAQLAVIKDGQMIKSTGYGYNTAYESKTDANGTIILDDINVIPVKDRVAVTPSTLFDLASNTKMYATVYSVQKLVTEGKLDINTPIYELFPDFINIPDNFKDNINTVENRKLVKVANLLHHDAGFLPDPQYHNENSKINDPNLDRNPLFTQDRDHALEMMLKTKLTTVPGTGNVYSDTDFMLLGAVVEKVTGQRLDTYVRENFTTPLGLKSVTFNPLQNGFTKDQVTASEVHGNTRDGRYTFSNVRHGVVQGEVHDEKAFYTMNGISGHAGLFGNAGDIATMAQVMLNNGGMGGNSFFSSEVIDTFTTPYGNVGNQDTYALGWRRAGESQLYKWAFSDYTSDKTVGHTGWTGTVTVIDPDNNVVIALMTNSRNTPIMNRETDAFYTANFNTNSYGPVTNTVYQALGLGSDESTMEYLKGLTLGEISNVSETSSASKRNAVRALFHVVETYSHTDNDAKTLWNSKEIQDIVLLLKDTYENDTKYLDQSVLGSFTKPTTLDNELIQQLKDAQTKTSSIDSSKYTKESYNEFKVAYDNVSSMLNEIALTQHGFTNDDLKEALNSLLESYDNLKEIEIVDPVDPVDPTDPIEKPDTKEPSTSEDTKEENKPLPSTGLNSNASFFIIGFILISAGSLFVLRNKRLNHNR